MLTSTTVSNSTLAHRQSPSVLLVEDDHALAEELVEAVSSAGIGIITADSAAEAVKALENRIDCRVVVTDIVLGDVSGLELLRKLSKLGPRKKIQAVVLSGHSTVDHVLNALRLGVTDFLPKPVMPEELIDAIRRALQRASADQPPARQLSRGEAAALLLKARKKRDSIFGADLFEDPAWNIMLDLYSSTLQGRTVTVSDLCVASGTSATTALRRLGTLADLGLIKRVADATDRRRVLVVQTELGRQAMDQFAEWLRDSLTS